MWCSAAADCNSDPLCICRYLRVAVRCSTSTTSDLTSCRIQHTCSRGRQRCHPECHSRLAWASYLGDALASDSRPSDLADCTSGLDSEYRAPRQKPELAEPAASTAAAWENPRCAPLPWSSAFGHAPRVAAAPRSSTTRSHATGICATGLCPAGLRS